MKVDNKTTAQSASESGMDFETASGLGIDQARDWGLYVSTPLDRTATGQPFAEPELFFSRSTGPSRMRIAVSFVQITKRRQRR